MEKNNEIINEAPQDAPKVKKPKSQAQREAQRRYYFKKLKNDPDYQERARLSSRIHYNNHREEVKERIRNYQREKNELAMIERLYEIQQEKKINDNHDEQFEKLQQKMMDKLAHLHLVLK